MTVRYHRDTLRTEAVVETALVATHMTRSYGSTNHANYYTAAVPFWRRPHMRKYVRKVYQGRCTWRSLFIVPFVRAD